VFYYIFYKLLYVPDSPLAVFNVFRYITFRATYASLMALILILLVMPWFIRKAKALGITEGVRWVIAETHSGKAGTPTMGGIPIVLATIISALLWARPNELVLISILALLWFGGIGFLDDYIKVVKGKELGLLGRYKLLLQGIGAAMIAVFLWFHPSSSSYPSHLSVPFLKTPIDIGLLYIPFAMLVIIGAANAVNLTDGLDGLASGCTLFAALSFSVLSYLAGNSKFSHYLGIVYVPGGGELAIICAILAGVSLGFLWFNSYPAQVFMGDTGAMAFGGAIGTIAVLIRKELVLVIVGGIFVAEALSVIIQVASYKLRGEKRVFKKTPLHHHFQEKGWEEPKIVIRFWIVAIILALISLSTLKLM
jgi:phospho-N-acetylmuramoyl-pentapeptide-transferase